jgi:hypothetical protein
MKDANQENVLGFKHKCGRVQRIEPQAFTNENYFWDL